MQVDEYKLAEFVELLEWHTPEEGLNPTILADVVGIYRASKPHSKKAELFPRAIGILGQGSKISYVGGKAFDYSVGKYLSVFLPMPIESVITEASLEKPMLMVGIRLDMHKIASLMLRIEQVEPVVKKPANEAPSSIFAAPLHNDLLNPVIRLLKVLKDPTDTAILADTILDEVYYRLLRSESAYSLRYMLQRREEIQQIARAVEHIHQYIDQDISVEELTDLANMSKSAFYRSFKEVMHMAPLQYAKSMKLHKAQALILGGKRANEAGYLVGYNSPAQFSREYKRQFGYAPSAT